MEMRGSDIVRCQSEAFSLYHPSSFFADGVIYLEKVGEQFYFSYVSPSYSLYANVAAHSWTPHPLFRDSLFGFLFPNSASKYFRKFLVIFVMKLYEKRRREYSYCG